MSTDFRELQAADRRRVILDTLRRDPHYEVNDAILQSVLDTFGHRVGRNQVKEDLVWLCEQSLVNLRDLAGVAVATLTTAGYNVAEARVIHPGVRRGDPPDPMR
ncbi:MAG: ArsR family transcriptional regulator [Magnetococcales bacterium]|nr:ArsR family transcriptional regulator [Magnetococcales bacterium]